MTLQTRRKVHLPHSRLLGGLVLLGVYFFVLMTLLVQCFDSDATIAHSPVARGVLGVDPSEVMADDIPGALEYNNRVEIGSSMSNRAKLTVIGVELGMVMVVGTGILVTLASLKPYLEKGEDDDLSSDPETGSSDNQGMDGSTTPMLGFGVAGPSGYLSSDNETAPLVSIPVYDQLSKSRSPASEAERPAQISVEASSTTQ